MLNEKIFVKGKTVYYIAKNIFFEEICDGVLCEAAESFEDEACGTLVVLN